MKFSKKITQIAKRIEKGDGRMFLVGGAVRDQFRAASPIDLDFMIRGITAQTAKEIISDFGTISDADVISNAPVFIARIDGEDFEFALARKEISVNLGKSGFEFFSDPSVTLEDDMLRRDFTIGAICQDVLTNEIVDLHNGIQDIKDGIIRCVDPETFIQSPERAFRAFSQAARFNFTVDVETSELIRSMKKDFHTIPKEQIWRHFEKFAKHSEKPENFLIEMVMAEWIEFFPEIHIHSAISALRHSKSTVSDVLGAIMSGMTFREENRFRARICIPKRIFKMAVEIKDNGAVLPKKWVNGRDIAHIINPGVAMGFWVSWAFIGQINGLFNTKEDAVSWVKESIKTGRK